MKRNFFGLTLLLVLVGFWGVSAYLFPFMPETMISHWGFGGLPDGYADKSIGLFMLPAIASVIGLVFWMIRSAKSVFPFRSAFDRFIAVFLLFFFYVHSFMLLWNLGSEVPVVPYLTSLFGILWYAIGALLSKSQPNPWIGIRTPWTFENPRVWEKTNRAAGFSFRLCALFSFATAVLPAEYAWYLTVIPPIAAGLIPVFYSYFIRRA